MLTTGTSGSDQGWQAVRGEQEAGVAAAYGQGGR